MAWAIGATISTLAHQVGLSGGHQGDGKRSGGEAKSLPAAVLALGLGTDHHADTLGLLDPSTSLDLHTAHGNVSWCVSSCTRRQGVGAVPMVLTR